MSKIEVVPSDKTEAVVKRMFWLAYQACGGTYGMGVFQARNNATEDQVWKNVQTRGDYPGNVYQRPGEAYGDYVFGRMMKLMVRYGPGHIEIRDSKPRGDCQAWCYKHKSYRDLIDAAALELGVTLRDPQAASA